MKRIETIRYNPIKKIITMEVCTVCTVCDSQLLKIKNWEILEKEIEKI